jgi:hypothetical protein
MILHFTIKELGSTSSALLYGRSIGIIIDINST